MEELITYKVTFKQTDDQWLFQYRKTDGVIHSFTNMKGNRVLTLLDKNQFPGRVKTIEAWSELKKVITIELILDDYSFDVFWEKYDLKQKKEFAEKAFNKLSLVDKIKSFAKLPSYDAYVRAKGINKQLMVTWINQKRYNDEFKI